MPLNEKPRPVMNWNLRRLAEIDRAAERDREFFADHPHRRHRLRPSITAEIEQQDQVEGRPVPIPPGWRWFTVIRFVPGAGAIRIFINGPAQAPDDVPEAEASELFDEYAPPQSHEVEAQLRKAARALR